MADKSLSDVINRIKAEGQLTRNSGKNSIKTIKELLEEQNTSSLEDKEFRREQTVFQERQLNALEALGSQPTPLQIEPPSGGGFGSGMLGGLLGGGIGGTLAGIGVGGGALAAGVGILAAGGGYLLNEIGEMDAEAIKQNVLSLISIGDAFEGGNWEFLAESGPLFIAMTGLGVALTAFAVGSGANAAVEYFAGDIAWAQAVKDNVVTLMSIPEAVGGNLEMLMDGATLPLAMAGLAGGLALFGAGSAIAGMAEGLASFTAGDDWSQQIKDHVVTLMSISDELGGASSFIGESATFLAAMTGIGLGLAVFGSGSAVAGLSQAVNKFSEGEDWTQTIKDNVLTLMSIEDSLGGKLEAFGESGTFLAVMSGIGAGLAAFGFGSTVAGVGEAINKFASEEDFAERIKRQVETLVSITDTLDGDSDTSKAGMFAAGMAKIGAGLTAFGAGQFVGTLANAGTAIAGLFGVDSPFDQIMDVAENAEDLSKGADAVEKIAQALDAFGNIRVSEVELDFEQLAENLARAIPLLRGLAEGGEVGAGWFDGPNIDFGRGLLDPSLKLDELAAATGQINYILSGGESDPSRFMPDLAAQTRQVSAIVTEEAAAAELRTTGGGSVNNNVVVPTDNSSTVVNRGGDVNINDRMMDPHNPDAFRDNR